MLKCSPVMHRKLLHCFYGNLLSTSNKSCKINHNVIQNINLCSQISTNVFISTSIPRRCCRKSLLSFHKFRQVYQNKRHETVLCLLSQTNLVLLNTRLYHVSPDPGCNKLCNYTTHYWPSPVECFSKSSTPRTIYSRHSELGCQYPQHSLLGRQSSLSLHHGQQTRSFGCRPSQQSSQLEHQHLVLLHDGQQTRSASSSASFDASHIPRERIRNFCIIAHVDHGKSTLADRILEMAGAIQRSDSNKQVLDTLQVERERGITVKAQTVSVLHTCDGEEYLLNLIDTPGHVDFSYEVSRSLSACQGAVLLVDANKGVQAQTVANFFLAFGADLTIVPALNKVDLPGADPDAVKRQLLAAFDIPGEDVLLVSAKLGLGVRELLDRVIHSVPPPRNTAPQTHFSALLYDSWFHPHKGAVCLIACVSGSVSAGDSVMSAATGKTYTVKQVGLHLPAMTPMDVLSSGQVGYLMASIKSTQEAAVGDTLKDARHAKDIPTLQGFRPAKPMVYAGVYPAVQSDATSLSHAMQKLLLNDSSVTATKESSAALGQGWRVGFLGLLHLDVFLQRLMQEHDSDTVTTAPSVPYKVVLKSAKAIKHYRAEEIIITNPLLWPDPMVISEALEPYVTATIITPADCLNAIGGLCQERRGRAISSRHLDADRVMAQYSLPLAEVVVDFYDMLKSLSSGYATFDYEEEGYRVSQLVKLGVLVNGEPVEELFTIVHASKARNTGRKLITKLKDAIPSHLFKVALQAVVGSTVVAREDIRASRKDVTAKCYGGDLTRKMKLLKRQAEGKERMRRVGRVNIPRQAFIDVLKK